MQNISKSKCIEKTLRYLNNVFLKLYKNTNVSLLLKVKYNTTLSTTI